MKHAPAKILLALLLILLVGAARAAADEGFGLKDLDLTFTGSHGESAMLAGSHPYVMTTTIDVNTTTKGGTEIPIDAVRDLEVSLPAGLVGDPRAVQRCSVAEFLDLTNDQPACSNASAVGLVRLRIGYVEPEPFTSAVFNLAPAPGAVEKLGFIALGGVPVTIEIGLNPDPPYNAIAHVTKIAQPIRFYGSELIVWGNPAGSEHDGERGSCISGGTCEAGIPPRPFLTLPGSCNGPLVTRIETDSWQQPGHWLSYEFETHDETEPPTPVGPLDCPGLAFAPSISAQATSDEADSPSGLDFGVDFADEGLVSPGGRAQSDIEKAVVTLPEGVTANPSLAEGLATCTEADFARETVDSEPGEGCPQASKIGTVEVETPLLEGELLKGQVFVATQGENPFHTLIALYMVIKDPELGILVKLPGKVEPDPKTGQLVTTFGEAPYEIPQFPFSHFRFHFREGGRSPLVTPPSCGSFQAKAVFTPWSNPSNPLEKTASFQITHGVGGGSCPSGGTPPFDPGFEAGSLNNSAGAYSTFLMRLTRRDGDQDLTKFSAKLPEGMTAKLAGVAQCSDADIAHARARTGTHGGEEELANPSCSANSQIGRVLAGAGVGSQLTYVPGKLYLAGPYNGAPLSVVAIVPAVAGPFDVGTVVTREALRIDPRTAEVEADGSASDPIPHILAGIPLKVRDIRVYVDRNTFTLNPTSCEPMATQATIWGGGSNVFSALDDSPVAREARFQAASCASLGFQPTLNLSLRGPSPKRGGHSALRALYAPTKQDPQARPSAELAAFHSPAAPTSKKSAGKKGGKKKKKGLGVSGSMRRGGNPALRAVVTMKPGGANIARASVALPHSEFLDQSHIRTICTRVQFAEGDGHGSACPAGSVYGHVSAVTPLLDYTLEGNVYLRSSEHKLPDLIPVLEGPAWQPIAVYLDGRIDSIHGGIRTTFEGVPDAPVSKFTLEMPAGKKGLIENSRNLCASGAGKATVNMTGQNGKVDRYRTALGTECPKRHKKHAPQHKRATPPRKG